METHFNPLETVQLLALLALQIVSLLRSPTVKALVSALEDLPKNPEMPAPVPPTYPQE